MRVCGHQIRQQPAVCLFVCVLGVGCATASRRSHFNWLTIRSIRFNSCSYASLPGETTSVFNHFKSPCWSKKLKASSQVMNLAKNPHQNFWEEHYTERFLCIVRSTQSAQHVKCSTCFFRFWDIPVTHGGMYNVKQCMHSKRHFNKWKAIASMLRFPILWVVRCGFHSIWT